MAEYIQKSRQIDLIEFKHAGGTINVTNAFANFEIQEDLFKDSLVLNIMVYDAGDNFNEVDFDGTETVDMIFKSMGKGDRQLNITFQVFKIEITPDPNAGYAKVYQIFGVTPEHYTQSTIDINKGYTSTVKSAVQDVYGKIGSSKPLSAHNTDGLDTFIIPGMTPFEAFQMLNRRAFSGKYASSLYTFYENMDGFNFHNVEQLIEEGKGSPYKYKYTPDSKLEKTGDPETQFMIEALEIDSNKDIMSRIKGGSYANQCKEIDLISQKINTNILLVKENFKDFVHVDPVGDSMTFDSKEMIDRHLSTINSTKWIHNTRANPLFANNFKSLIPRRRFYLDSLNSVEMRIRVPGNSNLTVGKILELNMLEISGKTENKQQEPKLSGNWLITQVTHLIDKKEYENVLVLHKESYRANVDNPEKNVVA